MKKRLIAMFLVLALTLVLMTAVAIAVSRATNACSHPNAQDLGPTDEYYVNYGSFHIKYTVHTWFCSICETSYPIATPSRESHTLPCALCGGTTMGIEIPEETA